MADKNDSKRAAGRGKAGEAQTATIRYIDRPECTETFADSINHVYFDGQSLRIEFGITRLDDVKPNTPVTGRRFPAQRMVLTPMAAVELINRMQQVGAALTQAGVVKANPKPTNCGYADDAELENGATRKLATPARLELATLGLGNRCSIQLSYGAARRLNTRARRATTATPARACRGIPASAGCTHRASRSAADGRFPRRSCSRSRPRGRAPGWPGRSPARP